jgi:acetaldehyde dehydrogenase (acetylating)
MDRKRIPWALIGRDDIGTPLLHALRSGAVLGPPWGMGIDAPSEGRTP